MKRPKKSTKAIRSNSSSKIPQLNLEVSATPLTPNQQYAVEHFNNGNNLVLHGLAGTGKTFLSLMLALTACLHKQTPFHSVTIVRSVVPTRDVGFLPGDENEKSRIYEAPYRGICNELFGRGDAYDLLKKHGIINFITTSFIRGTTINNSIIVVDEFNNMTFHELDSVITRTGKNCSLIFSGDYRQSDLTKRSDRAGLARFMEILSKIQGFTTVEFGSDDIVRSGLVRDYIIMKDRLGYDSAI